MILRTNPTTINLTQLRELANQWGAPYAVSLDSTILASLITAAEAARQVTDALDDAIKAHVNDSGWTQADYDNWCDARTTAENALARFDFTPTA